MFISSTGRKAPLCNAICSAGDSAGGALRLQTACVTGRMVRARPDMAAWLMIAFVIYIGLPPPRRDYKILNPRASPSGLKFCNPSLSVLNLHVYTHINKNDNVMILQYQLECSSQHIYMCSEGNKFMLLLTLLLFLIFRDSRENMKELTDRERSEIQEAEEARSVMNYY